MAESHVPLNGTRHWVRTVGDLHAATPLVVLHGGPGGFIYDFEQLTGPALEQLGPVVYYEQRGSGRSDRPSDGEYSIPVLVDDLEQLRRHLGVGRMTLLGISFGGELAAEYTVAYPLHVEKLILQGTGLAGPLTPSPWAAGFDAVAADNKMRTAIRTAVERSGPTAAWDVVDRATVDRFLFHKPVSAETVRALGRRADLSTPARCPPG
ncbi:alpha/beta fold hydrolase [Kribbella sp. NPDC049584]|uniref:alpha/beta fold hydrolase n=1 Tax=Kribbella sp. NPDC049584 TaxID=3154833 RepID=UPI003422B028